MLPSAPTLSSHSKPCAAPTAIASLAPIITPARVLPALVLAQLAGTSPWFAVNAVMPDLQRQYGWPAAAVGTLTATLQIGFIVGTLVFAVLAVADRWPARRVFLLCALATAGCTLAAVAGAGTGHFGAMLAWRALTGFFLAGIYPVGMKLASQWFPRGLGIALGWLLAALVLGSASPHALRAVGAAWPWQGVFFGVATASVLSGLIVWFVLPQPPVRAGLPVLRLSALASVWRVPRLRASVLGYFGHMWELYAMWVLVPLVLATRLAADASVPAWTFAVLGLGAVGCVSGGIAARHFGSARVSTTLLATSGLCCVAAPWLLTAPLALFLAWLLLWGFAVAGDSPQLSALNATNAPQQAVGSVLTLVNSMGFAISVVTIEVFARLSQTTSLAHLLPWLAVGPLLGVLAMRPLWAESKR